MKKTHARCAALLAAWMIASAGAAPLKVGVTPGALADSAHVAAAEAKRAGLDVEIVEFTDWTMPNTALDAGDIDLNYFQHQAFLDNAIQERGFRIESVAVGLLPNIGLYSKKVKSFAELREGALVGVADDPVNQGRGLLLLDRAGLVKLRPGVGVRGTVHDIVDNPRHFKLVEVPGPQPVRAIDDLDLAQGYPAHLVNAGQPELARSALLYSSVDDLYYAIRFVARSDRVHDARIRRFIEVYQSSDAVRARIKQSFAGDERLYSLPWLQQARP